MGGMSLAKVDVSRGVLNYYGNNNIGTPLLMTNAHGVLTWEADYKPFGEALVNPNSEVENNFRFPGQYYNSQTQLHYNYHRYYDPKIGKYLTPDPIGLEGGLNLFTYSRNDPVKSFDSLGLYVDWTDWHNIERAILYGVPPTEYIEWEDWGDYEYHVTITEGGVPKSPIFWLVIHCYCKRQRWGRKVTECEIVKVSKIEFKYVAGGYAMNEAAAQITCRKKCQELKK